MARIIKDKPVLTRSAVTAMAKYAAVFVIAAATAVGGYVTVDAMQNEFFNVNAMPSSMLEYTLSEDKKEYSITGIGNVALTEIVIPPEYNGIPVTSIGENAFAGNGNIVSVTLGEGIERIDMGAFAQCESLEKITLPKSM